MQPKPVKKAKKVIEKPAPKKSERVSGRKPAPIHRYGEDEPLAAFQKPRERRPKPKRISTGNEIGPIGDDEVTPVEESAANLLLGFATKAKENIGKFADDKTCDESQLFGLPDDYAHSVMALEADFLKNMQKEKHRYIPNNMIPTPHSRGQSWDNGGLMS